jgi:hypothetical protein
MVTATSVHLISKFTLLDEMLKGAETGQDEEADDVLLVAADVSGSWTGLCHC